LILRYFTGPGGAGVNVSEATAQMFDPDDPDCPVEAFLQEYQTLFGFGPEAITNATVQCDDVSAGNGARIVGVSLTTLTWSRACATILSHSHGRGIRASGRCEIIPALWRGRAARANPGHPMRRA
jgi:hypothetical protein